MLLAVQACHHQKRVSEQLVVHAVRKPVEKHPPSSPVKHLEALGQTARTLQRAKERRLEFASEASTLAFIPLKRRLHVGSGFRIVGSGKAGR